MSSDNHLEASKVHHCLQFDPIVFFAPSDAQALYTGQGKRQSDIGSEIGIKLNFNTNVIHKFGGIKYVHSGIKRNGGGIGDIKYVHSCYKQCHLPDVQIG